MRRDGLSPPGPGQHEGQHRVLDEVSGFAATSPPPPTRACRVACVGTTPRTTMTHHHDDGREAPVPGPRSSGSVRASAAPLRRAQPEGLGAVLHEHGHDPLVHSDQRRPGAATALPRPRHAAAGSTPLCKRYSKPPSDTTASTPSGASETRVPGGASSVSAAGSRERRAPRGRGEARRAATPRASRRRSSARLPRVWSRAPRAPASTSSTAPRRTASSTASSPSVASLRSGCRTTSLPASRRRRTSRAAAASRSRPRPRPGTARARAESGRRRPRPPARRHGAPPPVVTGVFVLAVEEQRGRAGRLVAEAGGRSRVPPAALPPGKAAS